MALTVKEPIVDQESLNKLQAEHRHSSDAPSQKTALPRWSKKMKDKSTVARVCTWIVAHQISISANLLFLLYATHILYPSSKHYTQKFFLISYFNPATGTYALGWDDIFFVFHWIIVFTGLRCAVMDYLLTPLAGKFGLQKRKAKDRFAEQAWILIYYTCSWCAGMYIMYNSDYWLNLRALWSNWPIREMDGLSKWYYLVQFAFWLQQIVVVNIEERRKDHWQMFTHHIITCALIFGSYGYHQTKVGTLILCLMDVVDLFLPLAKILRYLKYQTACDVTFGIFMVTWFIARHILYGWTCWSVYYHIPQEIKYGCYKGSVQDLQGPFPVPDDYDHLTQPFRDPVGLVCWNGNIKWGFLTMLLALQGVLLMWFVMIVRVAYRVLSGQGADDTRSDDEDDDEEEEQEEEELKRSRILRSEKVHTTLDTKPVLEKEVLSTDSTFITTSRPVSNGSTAARSPTRKTSRRKGEGHSSGVNLLNGSDRKEFLGRIGCDKGVAD